MGNSQQSGKALFYQCGDTKWRFPGLIVYDRLWKMLKERGISQYKLIKEYHISTGQLDRLRKNANVNTYTLNQLCEIVPALIAAGLVTL